MSDWSEFWGTVILLGMFAVACGSLYAIDWLKKMERREEDKDAP